MKKSSPVSRSGRFAGGPAADVAQFTESISFDQRLWRHDIAGSIAHATMLCKVGILTQRELRAIIRGLDAIAKEIAQGKFRWQAELEDVHMNIESALTRRVPAGAKLHTGRSRNDQVALDMRLWLREQIVELRQEIRLLQRALVEFGEREREVVIPGYTHLQRAQPVYLAHHLLAYAEMLARDSQRLQECFTRVNVCPLGSGALAGSTLPLDRELVRRALLLMFAFNSLVRLVIVVPTGHFSWRAALLAACAMPGVYGATRLYHRLPNRLQPRTLKWLVGGLLAAAGSTLFAAAWAAIAHG